MNGLKNSIQSLPVVFSGNSIQRATIVTILLTIVLGMAVSRADDSKPEGAFIGAMQTEYPDWFKTSFMELEDDILEAREAGKRLMIVFHQDGCPYCNAFVERNLAQKDIEQTVRSNFDVIEINMWGDREVTNVNGDMFTEKLFAEALKVQFTPTVIFYNEKGDFALRINGYYPPDKFRQALDYVIDKRDVSETFTQYLERNEKDSASESEVIAAKLDLSKRPYIDGDASDFSQLAKVDKPMILLFEQKDCSNCQLLDENVLKLAETDEYLSRFNVVRLDMWGKETLTGFDGRSISERELADSLSVSYAPTLIFYAAEGQSKQEVIRSESWFKRFHTQSLMDYVSSDAWKEQPNFQRYISARAEAIREEGIDVNIYD